MCRAVRKIAALKRMLGSIPSRPTNLFYHQSMTIEKLDEQLAYEDKAWEAISFRLRDVRDWEGSLIEMGLDAACDAPKGERGWHWNLDKPNDRSCRTCVNRGRFKQVESLLNQMFRNGLVFQYGGENDKVAGYPESCDSDEEEEAWDNLRRAVKKRVLKQRLKHGLRELVGNFYVEDYYTNVVAKRWEARQNDAASH